MMTIMKKLKRRRRRKMEENAKTVTRARISRMLRIVWI